MTPRNLSAEEARNVLVTILAGEAGGTEAAWDSCIGEMVRVDLARSPRTNWTIRPTRACRLADRATITRAVDLVKAEHPFVRW